jgi:hypothetical protein
VYFPAPAFVAQKASTLEAIVLRFALNIPLALTTSLGDNPSLHYDIEQQRFPATSIVG